MQRLFDKKKEAGLTHAEIAYKDNPELLEFMQDAAFEDGVCTIVAILHENGYTFFNLWRLTWWEIKSLMHGNRILAEKRKQETKVR